MADKGDGLIVRLTDADAVEGGLPVLLSEVSRRGARGVVLDGGGRVALCLMAANGLSKLPGGGVEEGESHEDAFLREVAEETGLSVRILECLGRTEEHKARGSFLHVSRCFLAQALGQGQKALTGEELKLGFSFAWHPYPEAVELMRRSVRDCRDYQMKFMMLRDLAILERAGERTSSFR